MRKSLVMKLIKQNEKHQYIRPTLVAKRPRRYQHCNRDIFD